MRAAEREGEGDRVPGDRGDRPQPGRRPDAEVSPALMPVSSTTSIVVSPATVGAVSVVVT